MLKEYLQEINMPRAEWSEPMPGVQVCRFELSAPHKTALFPLPINSIPLHFEAFFCQGGHVVTELFHGRLLTAKQGEIFLLSDSSRIRSFQISEDLKGILVAVNAAEARKSLFTVCSALGLKLDTKQVRQTMAAQDGCAVLSDIPWTQAAFECIESLSGEEQTQYCVFKSVELLYLFCTYQTPLTQKGAAYTGNYIVRSVIQAHDYMETHLSEKMTLSELSRKFFISPTSLKNGFRRMYGATPHRWLIEQRMKRALALLQSTDMTILEIARSVGYEGVSQFNIAFKQCYGITPGQFTKMSKTSKTCPFP